MNTNFDTFSYLDRGRRTPTPLSSILNTSDHLSAQKIEGKANTPTYKISQQCTEFV